MCAVCVLYVLCVLGGRGVSQGWLPAVLLSHVPLSSSVGRSASPKLLLTCAALRLQADAVRSSKLAGGGGSSKAAKASCKTAAQQEEEDELDLDTYEEDDAHGYEVRGGRQSAELRAWACAGALQGKKQGEGQRSSCWTGRQGGCLQPAAA